MRLAHSIATSLNIRTTTELERALGTTDKYKSSENVYGASASMKMDSAKSVLDAANLQKEEDTQDSR
jgi:hypothetical protein